MFQRPNFQKFVRFPFNNYNSENKKGKIIRTIKRPLKLKIKNSYCLKDLEHHCKSYCKKALSFFNHRMCSVKKGVLRNFAKFTGKHLCQSLFSNNVAGGTFEIQKQNHPLEKCSAVLTNVFLKILFLCTSILILIT